jgi:hypothetical protein
MGASHTGRLLLGGSVLILAAGCAGSASLRPTPTPPPAPTATTTATPAPAATPAPSSAPAAPSVTPLSLTPAAAHQPQTIHLILHAINDKVGSLQGVNFMVGYDPMFDAATGKEVGTFAYECFLVDVGSALYHCPGVTITLSGRGQIAFTEVIQHEPGMPPAIAPITGGTGEFLGATGDVTAKVLPTGGDFVITITR